MFCNSTTMCAATSPGFIQWNSFMSLLLRMSCLKVCRTHTLYQNGSHHPKSNTSFYSICPYESTRGRYLQTDPFFIHRHDFFFLNRHDETHYFPTLPKNSILIFPMYLDLTETSSHKLKNLSVSNLYHYLNKLTFAFNYSN